MSQTHSHASSKPNVSERHTAPRHEAVPVATPEAIAARAYGKYLARGCLDGHDSEDWLSAELELQAEQGTTGN